MLAKNTHLANTVSLDRLNLRLASASAYLAQFSLNIRYRPGQIHLVLDALSRCKGDMSPTKESEANVLDNVPLETTYAFSATLIKIHNDFKKRVIAYYESDPHYKRILAIINAVKKGDDTVSSLSKTDQALAHSLRYYRRNGLVYFINQHLHRDRLCIPEQLAPKVFEIAHDSHHHAGEQ